MYDIYKAIDLCDTKVLGSCCIELCHISYAIRTQNEAAFKYMMEKTYSAFPSFLFGELYEAENPEMLLYALNSRTSTHLNIPIGIIEMFIQKKSYECLKVIFEYILIYPNMSYNSVKLIISDCINDQRALKMACGIFKNDIMDVVTYMNFNKRYPDLKKILDVGALTVIPESRTEGVILKGLTDKIMVLNKLFIHIVGLYPMLEKEVKSADEVYRLYVYYKYHRNECHSRMTRSSFNDITIVSLR